MRRLALSLLVPLSLPALPSQAQEVSWGDILSPDRLGQIGLQYGLSALRTVADVTYADLSVDAMNATATVYDLVIWPGPDGRDADCRIDVGRVDLMGAPLGSVDVMRVTATLHDLTVAPACIPPDAMMPFAVLNIREFTAPRANVTLAYTAPDGSADVSASASFVDVGTVTLNAALDYISLREVAERGDRAEPVAYLSHASLSIDNDGIWQKAAPIVPTPLKDPTSGPRALVEMMRAGMDDMRRPQPPAESPAFEALLNSAAATWARFLATPGSLVLETGLAEDETFRINDIDGMNDPLELLEALRPTFSVTPRATQEVMVLSDAAIAAAEALLTGAEEVDETPLDGMAMAFLKGSGVPQNIQLGLHLLARKQDSLSDADKLVVAEVLAESNIVQAYGFALQASAAAVPGATSMLDRLEREVPATDGLDVQDSWMPQWEPEYEIARMRSNALAHFGGRGAERSYALAAYWATMAAAAGDQTSVLLLEDIDRRITALGWSEAWANVLIKVQDAATKDWLSAGYAQRLTSQ